MNIQDFSRRHIGPNPEETQQMLDAIGATSIDDLIDQTVPAHIRLKKPLNIAPAVSEHDYLEHIHTLGLQNKVNKSYIGLGYHPTLLPPVIQRNILENPGWYTAYTPYQAEISQGRLEALLNFQTMVMELTGMELANASLLDEGTAAAEAMLMLFSARSRQAVKAGKNVFLVDKFTFSHTQDILHGRAKALGIDLQIVDLATVSVGDDCFGVLVQYPNSIGSIQDWQNQVADWKSAEIGVAVVADLLSLTLITPPGEWGADVVVGSAQRFGVPMGMGGPHAAYFATKEAYKRQVPGRIIGVSIDSKGRQALRMALQTREQHIKRDKATSNICTAQALLAIMAGMYAVYHGPQGLKQIALNVHNLTIKLAAGLKGLGLDLVSDSAFDTLTIAASPEIISATQSLCEEKGINLNFYIDGQIGISLNEATQSADVDELLTLFGQIVGQEINEVTSELIPKNLERTSEFLTHSVFNRYHSESELMRYMKRLENKDISLTHSMISLGSCTMKLNAAAQLIPLTQRGFANIHPFAPKSQLKGYYQIFDQLGKDLCEITGFEAVSFQPNSGAQGEYAGLAAIASYHEKNGDTSRKVILIPSSAHGTNPASAAVAGLKVVVTKCDDNGNINLEDLADKISAHKAELAGLMVTYPSTHGVFEEDIQAITQMIHEAGGLVYMDGANMNAQVGITNPATIGADVCHLNLHKTFAIPHGGGGPGMGPILVNDKLKNHLPVHVFQTTDEEGIHAVSSAHFGSALILLISYGYIKMLGAEGVTNSTKMAILNANYIKQRLSAGFGILYTGKNGRVAHEMILDCREFKKTAGIEVTDIAKRLIDYGFHSPTVSFPVAATLMIEPTESESKEELDRFCDAMLSIRQEIEDLEKGIAKPEDNLLVNAPHTIADIMEEWSHDYSKTRAIYPLAWIAESKYWAPVNRIDNAHGDRNLVCSCPPLEAYAEVV